MKTRLTTLVAACVMVASAAVVMKNEGILANRFGTVEELPADTRGAAAAEALPATGEITELSADTTVDDVLRSSALPQVPDLSRRVAAPARLAALDAGVSLPDTIRTDSYSEYGLPCEVEMATRPGPMAVLHVSLAASCQTYTRVLISHDGLRFSELTSATGTLEIDIPALSTPARVSVMFEDGSGASTETDLQDLDSLQRVALQWRGETGLQLHALENGAGYGDPGHIWAENPVASGDGAVPGGFLSVLGDPTLDRPLLAEVYTYPADPGAAEGVRLNVETEVSDLNCGRIVEGQTLQTGPEGVTSVDLTFEIPECDALGGFLVLKNFRPDPTLARK